MKISTTEKGEMVLNEVYNPVTLKSNAKEKFQICMRDSGFEFTYNNEKFEAKEGKINPLGDPTLMLADDVYNQLFEGKRVTIRKGRRNISIGGLFFEAVDSHRIEYVEVFMVYHCKLKDVDPADIQRDGFDNLEHMVKEMKRFYPDIDKETEVTVIKFILR